MSRPQPIHGRAVMALTTNFEVNNGIGSYVRQFLASLHRVRPDWDVRMVTLGPLDASTVSDIGKLRLAGSKIAFARSALWWSIVFRPKEIIVFHIALLPLSWICGLLSGARLHVLTYGWEISRNGSAVQSLLLDRVDRIYSISRWTAIEVERFRRSAHPRAEVESIGLLPPTYDEGLFSPNTAEGLDFRRRLAIGPDDPVILTVGRLVSSERSKGHDRVIAVLPRLIRRFPDLKYVVAGEGDDLERLKRAAESCGMAAVVRFVGYVEDLRPCYSASDVFVMPSTQEGFGIVYIEAMACGLPVVAGGVDGSVSALSWGECGYLCDPYSSESVEAAITLALGGRTSSDRSDPAWVQKEARARFGNDRFDDRLDLLLNAECPWTVPGSDA